MKTTLVSLQGDPIQNLYQLGLKEKESFLKLEERVNKLLSTNSFLRFGQNILIRARSILKKKDKEREETLFEQCIKAYAEGLGIDVNRYMSFIALFELAAHYGQVYPELKGILPGCTSVFAKTDQGVTHSRLIDFPLLGVFDENPRLYYWQIPGKPTILSYSCEGLAPLFFQVIHESGISIALHHKPGGTYHKDGMSIFQIAFETLFTVKAPSDIRKELKKYQSVTKWSFLWVSKNDKIEVIDIDGPTLKWHGYDLKDESPHIFTNIPIQSDAKGFESFLNFCHDRQVWLKEKLSKKSNHHSLDLLTDVTDQKEKKWSHPSSTLSTTGAIHINLSQGFLDVKEGQGVLVASDSIIRFSLADKGQVSVLKPQSKQTEFEFAWKRAALAQSYFDQGKYDLAYHELQMAEAQITLPVWKEVFSFYLCVWDFKFISNSKELSHVYKKLKKLKVPALLKDQWLLLLMRMEKKLGLVATIKETDVSPHLRDLFKKEYEASKPVFATWMKLLYPRIEILDVFSPHH